MDWVMPTGFGEDRSLYSAYEIKCWSPPETPSLTYPEIMFLPAIWAAHSLAKLTHKINHYRHQVAEPCIYKHTKL